MADDKNIYFSLDEARDELKKRWINKELKAKIEEELGGRFMAEFRDSPRGVTFRQMCSPDNGFTFFYQCAKYIGIEPLVLEYHEDMFTHMNEEKKGLGRLSVTTKEGEMATVDIMNFHENEKKKLGECSLKTGEKLTNFHQDLFDVLNFKVDFLENSKWFQEIGKAQDYYYYLLLHFVVHGVLLETFYDEGGSSEDKFTSNIILPVIDKIRKKFDLSPLLVRSYPSSQNDDEDFYWWSYPPVVNDFILEYAKNNNFDLKIKNKKNV